MFIADVFPPPISAKILKADGCDPTLVPVQWERFVQRQQISPGILAVFRPSFEFAPLRLASGHARAERSANRGDLSYDVTRERTSMAAIGSEGKL